MAVIRNKSMIIDMGPTQLMYTLSMFAIAIVMPVFPSRVCDVYWERATKEAAIVSAVVGAVLVLMAYFVWNIGGTWYGAIGMLGSTVTMIVVSLLTKPRPEDSKDFYEALERTMDEFYEIQD